MSVSKDDMGLISQRCKNKKKRNGIKAASIVLVGVVLLYLAAAVFVSVYNNLSTTVAETGVLRETVRTDGYIFRHQRIISSPGAGHLECIAREGERVKEGQVLGYMYETPPDAALMEQIKEVHREIQSIGINVDASVYSSSPATAEKRIAEITRDLSDLRPDGDLSKISDRKEEINTLISRKNAGADGSVVAENPAQLKEKLSSLLFQAGNGRAIIAPSGGVFSTRIDGFEEALAYDKASSVTVGTLKELSKTEEREDAPIEAGQPLCKVVDNYSWCIAVEIEEEDAEALKEGQEVKLELFDLSDTAIVGRISRISDAENGKRAVVISTNKYVEGIYSSSKIGVDLVLVSYEGIKLPSQCLHVKDGATGVYVLRLDVAKFVPVNVRYKNDDWAIVSAVEATGGGPRLQIYDEVIVACRNLEDGKILR